MDRWLKERSKLDMGTIIAGSLLGVFVVDYVMPREIHFTVFYLIPVSLASWYASKRFGVLTSLASAAAWHYADSFSRTDMLSAWNLAVIYGIFIANALSVSKLKEDRLQHLRAQADLRAARVRIDELASRRALCERCGQALGPDLMPHRS